MIITIIIFFLYFLIPAIIKVFIFPLISSHFRSLGSPYSSFYFYKDFDLNKKKSKKCYDERWQELKKEINSW